MHISWEIMANNTQKYFPLHTRGRTEGRDENNNHYVTKKTHPINEGNFTHG